MPEFRASILAKLQGTTDARASLPVEIGDETEFKKRFGFVWSQADRRALFEMKAWLDLTDLEIRFLEWIGDLQPKADRLSFTVYPAVANYMFFMMWVLLLVFGIPLLSVVMHLEHPLQSVRAGAGLAVLYCFAKTMHFVFVRSHNISKRIRARLAAEGADERHAS